MFDVGFSELIVIALVALIVIGPERLPRVARTLGALMGRAQRYVNDVKADIQREVDLEELKNIKSTFQDAARSVEQSVNQIGQEFQAARESLNQDIAGTAQGNAEPTPPLKAPAADETPSGSTHTDLASESKETPGASTHTDLASESKETPGASTHTDPDPEPTSAAPSAANKAQA